MPNKHRAKQKKVENGSEEDDADNSHASPHGKEDEEANANGQRRSHN